MKNYNGFRSWNCWNVNLWITNTESYYDYALHCIKTGKLHYPHNNHKALTRAVNMFTRTFGGSTTPDGAKYNRLSIKTCLESLFND